MFDLSEHLVELSDKLDKQGSIQYANIIDDVIKNASLVKVSQYVGVIGYVLRQNRAMGNCIRKKRVASNNSMQDVVLECLKEYQDGSQYNDSEWAEKYAQVIQSVPDLFSESHLQFLQAVSEENDIQQHIENLRQVTAVLKNNNLESKPINEILSHYDALNGIIESEGNFSSRPFRFAATRSPRKWWERIFTPSRGDWWGFLGTGRGEDEDTKREMSFILENLRGIALITQKMKTGIYRLQNEIAARFHGQTQAPPLQEASGQLESVVSKINEVDLNSWSKTVIAVQQLELLLKNTALNNPKNQELLERATSIANGLDDSIRKVYEHITSIQENMYSLRQREPVMGRDFGDSLNPMSLSSPSNEFGELEKALRRLYKNPFDDKSLYYAEKLHSILDDKLRRIVNENADASEYLQSLNQPEEVRQTPDTQTAPPVPSREVNINDPDLINIVDSLSKQNNVSDIINLLTSIYNATRNIADPNLKQSVNTLKMIRDLLLEKFKSEQGTAAEPTPATTSVPTSQSAPSPQPPQPTLQTQSSPVNFHQQSAEEFNKNKGISVQDYLNNISGKGKSRKRSIAMQSMIKLADALDEKHPEIADLIDKYIEEHSQDIDYFIEFPSFGTILKAKSENK